MMKIAFISQAVGKVVPPVESGSIGIWIYQVAYRLAAMNHEVMVYAPEGPAFKTADIVDKNVVYRYVPSFVNRVFNKVYKILLLNKKKLQRSFALSLYHFGFILLIALNLRKERADIVHLHNYSQFVPVIRFFNKRIKIVLHMHCEWLTQLDKKVIDKRLAKCDMIVGCSDYIVMTIKNKFPAHADKCRSMYNGVDIGKFALTEPREAKKTQGAKIVFVGRLSPEKGLHTLMQAFNRVHQTYPETQLIVVGGIGVVPREFIVDISEDPLVQKLEFYYRQPASYDRQLKDLLDANAADKVVFTGRQDHSKIITYYQDADILVNPSLSESFGMSLIEGMAASLPVVATRIGGMVGVVDEGKTGLLVEPDNVEALADALITMITDKKKAVAMGNTGFLRVGELFSWDSVVTAMINDYTGI